MNFIKNVFSFHADVFKKISLNKGFFLFATIMYLVSDFIIYLQPLMSNYFSDTVDGGFGDMFLKWGLFILMWMAYFVSASLYSTYFIRREKNLSKFKYYLKPMFNMRVYGVYFFFVFGLLLAFVIATKFLPAVSDFLSEGLKILVDNKISSEEKLNHWLSSPSFIAAIEKTSIWQWVASFLSFILIVLGAAMSFMFALPLVVKNKSNSWFYSIKTSFNGAQNNFSMFFFTIIFMILFKYIGPMIFELAIPVKLMELLVENGFNYLTRPLVSLYDALLLFYVIIGFEKFILTIDKNNV
jgi:hypothetical protein